MDNYPGVKTHLGGAMSSMGEGVAKAPWRYGRGSEARAASQACFHSGSIHTPRALSHAQTVESGTRSRESTQTHTTSPTLPLSSHIHM